MLTYVVVIHRTTRFVTGRGVARRAHDPNRLERVTVIYHIGVIHEYRQGVQTSALYPADTTVHKVWPIRPPYEDPIKYITEKIHMELSTLDNLQFRGEECQHVMQSVKDWRL